LTYACSAQTSVYLRFIDYSGQILKIDGTKKVGALITGKTIDPTSQEFFKSTTFSQDAVQTLNIGSQSTGAGAGKIAFNPMAFSRPVDAASPIFFSLMASGTPYRTVEAFVTDQNNQILVKQLYKLVAVKTIGWAAASCTSDCPAALENVSMEYGGLLITIYKSGNIVLPTPITLGWNRVKNIQDNDPNTVIQ
jgi:type VI protein secretion system component Hcp